MAACRAGNGEGALVSSRFRNRSPCRDVQPETRYLRRREGGRRRQLVLHARQRQASAALTTVVLGVVSIATALAARLRATFGADRGSGGRGLAGSRVPRRPRLPFLPARGAAATPDEEMTHS